MLTVHHLDNSRSQRVLWLLEELGLPYEILHYQRNTRTLLAPPELRAIHPLGKAPVITHDGRTIAESGAIVEYLVNVPGQGRLIPAADSDDRLRYTYWMHYAEGSLMPLLLLKLVFGRISRPPMPWLLRPLARAIERGVRARLIDPQLALHMDFLEAELARSQWFAGAEFTAADIQMSFPLEAAQKRGVLRAAHQRLQHWLEVIRSRPAYRRAIEKGGPYSLLG